MCADGHKRAGQPELMVHMCVALEKRCRHVAILFHTLTGTVQLSLLLTGVSIRHCIFFILVIAAGLK